MTETLLLGEFQVTSGKLRITDPCYAPDVWCSGEIPAENGTWNAKIVVADEGQWGKRVSKLICQLIDGPKAFNGAWREELSFEVGVDSGQAGVYDAEKYLANHGGEYGETETFYGRVCEQTLGGSHGGVIEWGATSRSGYGDGGYPGYVRKIRNGNAIEVEIDFFNEET